MEDTENSSLYEAEKELAMNLVRYDWPFMKGFILTEIEKQHQPELFSFAILNSLSWIIGSLCGAMQEREEKSFFISCLKVFV